MREMVGGCCVCSDDRGWSENPLVYCDGQSCTVAVHQACYGIVTVPTGPWYCRKCESQERAVKVKCELCPSKYGALKRTDNSGWAHVVCALYIPEVRFGNVTTMEPIQLQLIPAERFNKVCYICEEKGKASSATVGACMQCNKAGCKQQFHVTCAQGLGLLCEGGGKLSGQRQVLRLLPAPLQQTEEGRQREDDPPLQAGRQRGPQLGLELGEGAGERAVQREERQLAPSSSKRKSSVASKSAPSKTSGKSSSSSQQKAVHNHNKNSDKSKVSNAKSAKSEESGGADNANADVKLDKKDSKGGEPAEAADPGKEGKGSKKRKANSRTPTPVSVVPSEVSVVVTAVASVETVAPPAGATLNCTGGGSGENPSEKIKKAKVETTQSIITNQPVVALTSISTIKSGSPLTTIADAAVASDTSPHTAPPTLSIIQTAQTQSQSLVVSVPLVNTSLSPHHAIINNTNVLVAAPVVPERSSSVGSTERSTPNIMTGANSNQGILTSEMSGGGLKITYEKQVDSINTEVDMELELEPSHAASVQPRQEEEQQQRQQQQRGNGVGAQLHNTLPKRSSRSQHVTPPPAEAPPGAFAAISQSQIKDSPPSSPSSESQSAPPSTSRGRARGRKSAPAAVGTTSGSSKDSKDVKLFQNGLTAPHMLGNQLNPNSNMHSKMTDHLNSELEAHSIFNPNENASNLMGPQLHHKVLQSARASSTGSSTASGGSGLSSMLGGGGGNIPQTLDQLLERQWEQGSQFLMEQAQHFDIASLLSCLHQLRAENLRLEEHVGSLLQRRDHLLAVNARLAIPLTGQPATPQSSHPHTVNNIHPSVVASHGDIPRTSRHSGGSSGYPSHPQATAQHPPVENGLPPEAYQQNSRRSPAGSQASPTVRHSPAGAYPNSGLHRQNADTSGRSAPRPQPYPLYDRPGPSSQQVVIRRERGERDSDIHHHNPSKPS
ncbi:hypothetical protein NQ318_019889 [Aromia moschata]|uniref:Protein AF-10 n=1 Tax=Aromia moschata TaxID=1265417 RepID=A0AAV8YJX1_9CUCU|nr:hypothetical protein NQ318_019889 [Aromia moschata]